MLRFIYQKHDARPHPKGLPFGQMSRIGKFLNTVENKYILEVRLRRSGVWQRRSCFGCSGSDPSLKAGVSVGPRHDKGIFKRSLLFLYPLYKLFILKQKTAPKTSWH